jgi:predicted metal-dependent phosphoesterase TrpH
LDWEAKGVIPLLYDKRNNHSKLHKTLKVWANYCRDGLNGVERIIKTYAVKIPTQPYEHDDSVKRVFDNLNKTEYAAKIFRSISSPPAPIERLSILEKEGLLAKSKVKQKKINSIIYYCLLGV